MNPNFSTRARKHVPSFLPGRMQKPSPQKPGPTTPVTDAGGRFSMRSLAAQKNLTLAIFPKSVVVSTGATAVGVPRQGCIAFFGKPQPSMTSRDPLCSEYHQAMRQCLSDFRSSQLLVDNCSLGDRGLTACGYSPARAHSFLQPTVTEG